MKPLSIDAAIDQIETALFDQSEPGCTDTEWGELCINSIGRIRLKAILKRLRVGYIKHTPIESLDPHDIAVRKKPTAASRHYDKLAQDTRHYDRFGEGNIPLRSRTPKR